MPKKLTLNAVKCRIALPSGSSKAVRKLAGGYLPSFLAFARVAAGSTGSFYPFRLFGYSPCDNSGFQLIGPLNALRKQAYFNCHLTYELTVQTER